MVEALSEDERRKFIWAEISYLDRWWSECGEEKRRKFKRSFRPFPYPHLFTVACPSQAGGEGPARDRDRRLGHER